MENGRKQAAESVDESWYALKSIDRFSSLNKKRHENARLHSIRSRKEAEERPVKRVVHFLDSEIFDAP